MSTIFFFYYACLRLPLGDLQCILYQSPLWVVFFGWIVFKEQLPALYILIPSIILTVTGVILVSQPQFLIGNSSKPLNIDGVIAILLTSLRWVVCVILVKKAQNVNFLQYEFSAGICTLCIALPLLTIINSFLLTHSIDIIGNVYSFYKMDVWSILSCVYCGIAAFVAMSLNVMGYQIGNSTVVSWLEYINIPISFLYQMYIFHDEPNIFEYIGGILVLIGCVLPSIHQTINYFI
eukprot:UN13125